MPSRFEFIPGWFDFQAIYDTAVFEAANGARFVEVGVWQGRSLCYLAEAARESGKRIHIYGVDPFWAFPDQEIVCQRNLVIAGVRDLVELVRKTSVDAAVEINGPLDFVFIDGDHTEPAVRQDIDLWWPKVRRGGVLAGHDYTDALHSPGVRSAVDTWSRDIKQPIRTWGSSWWTRKLD